MTAKEDKEAFLSRWSRLKEETKQPPPQKAPEKAVDPRAPAPELPPLDKLTFDSDYRGFFHPKVDEGMRRAALKKLFTDPRFNVMDGLDTYIDDYSKSDPIPAAMLAGLKQAQNILQWAKEDTEKRNKEEAERLQAKEGTPQALEPPAAPSTATEVQSDAPDPVPAAPDARRAGS
ncbi:MAG: DUF3306 domain-containing protein [Betaproteobacteria bacterium]|nr:DUF3306 domain-containing protein [Betaproteobacteria bacterium]